MGYCLLVLVIFIAAFLIINKLWCFWSRSKVCLVGKTALITGGASGIGYNAALGLASKGCTVIIADVVDTTKPVQDIITATHNPHIIGKKLNLASFQSVRDLAKDLNGSIPRLDILINNAGIGQIDMPSTEDGLDRTLQINYYGHFLLTHLLLDLLKKSAPSRIVFASSVASYFCNIPVSNLNPTKFQPSLVNTLAFGTYGASKLCMAIASRMFGEKLRGTGVTANSYHPGGAKTQIFFNNFNKTWKDVYRVFIGLFVYFYGKTAEEAAQTLIHLAHADEIQNTTGKLFAEGRPIFPPSQMRDLKCCEQLWEKSILYTKLEPGEIKC